MLSVAPLPGAVAARRDRGGLHGGGDDAGGGRVPCCGDGGGDRGGAGGPASGCFNASIVSIAFRVRILPSAKARQKLVDGRRLMGVDSFPGPCFDYRRRRRRYGWFVCGAFWFVCGCPQGLAPIVFQLPTAPTAGETPDVLQAGGKGWEGRGGREGLSLTRHHAHHQTLWRGCR